MRGNKINPEIMFTEKGNIKPMIVSEVAEKTAFCKKAVPKSFKDRGMEEPKAEIQKRLRCFF